MRIGRANALTALGLLTLLLVVVLAAPRWTRLLTRTVPGEEGAEEGGAAVPSAPPAEGEYDIVVDFGNDSTTLAGFLQDDHYDMPLDMIDGYVVPGFRVVPDPAVDTSFSHVGAFTYSQPNVTVTGDGRTTSVPIVAWSPRRVCGLNVPSTRRRWDSASHVIRVSRPMCTVALLAFEREPQRIDKSMAFLASGRLGLQRDSLSSGVLSGVG